MKLFYGFILAGICAATVLAADTEINAPFMGGYFVELPARGEVSVVMPVYCMDPDKDAPVSGAEMKLSPQPMTDGMKRIMRVKEILLSQADQFQGSGEEILQGFRGVYNGNDAYYQLVDRGTQWALWRKNKAGFFMVVESRITILEQYAGLLRSIAASLSGETADDIEYECHIANTEKIKDEKIRAEVRILLQSISNMRESGRLFAVRDAMMEKLNQLAEKTEKTAEQNKYYCRMAGIIDLASAMLKKENPNEK